MKRIALAAGVVALMGAYLPALHAASEDLFSAHMVQHLLLMLVAPALLAAGVRRVPVPVGPIPVVIAHAAVVWAWHLPRLYDAALQNPFLHGLEHLSFLATGLAVWAYALGKARPVDPLQRVAILFVTGMQSGALGALLVFATSPLYRAHAATTAGWGMTPLQDQQLAGGVMWVPPGVVYLVAILVLLFRWFNSLDAAAVAEER